MLNLDGALIERGVPSLHYTGDVPDGFIDPRTGNVVSGTPIYSTLAQLEAAFPATSNQDLVGIAGGFAWISNGVYYEQVSRDIRAAKSIMWLGDSKTSQAVPYATPLASDKSLPLFKPNAAGFFPNLNTVGTFVADISIDFGATAGTGTLAFTKATNLLTWTAPGDAAGAGVDVSLGGWFRLESATAGKGCYVCVLSRNVPASDKSDSLNYSAYPATVDFSQASSVPAMWNALNGNPFGENQYFYAIGGATPSDIMTAATWKDVYTDITHIDLSTNGFSAVGDVATAYTALTSMITLRQQVGSRVILALPNLDDLDYTVVTSIPKWKAYLGAKLRDYCRTNNIEYYAPAEFLNTGNSLSNPNVAANFHTDTVHYAQRGTYLIAKYLLDPILGKYAPKSQGLPNPLVSYDATNAPNGNLIVNGTFVGMAGTAGAGTSGGVPTSWSASRGSGSVILAVFSAVARPDKKYGNLVRCAVDNTGGVANEMIRLSATSALTAGNFSVGDKVVLSAEMFVAGTGINGIKLYLWSSAGGYLYALNHTSSSALGDAAGDTVHYVLQSFPFTIQTGFSSIVPRYEFTMAANGVANFDLVPNLCLRKVLA